MSQSEAPICPYCQQPAKFLPTSESIYRGQDYGPIWVCSGSCDAYVGADRTTLKPLGRLATKPLRVLKMRVHALFDPLWRPLNESRNSARRHAYAWLATRLDIPASDCHIALFDEERCRIAIDLLTVEAPTAATVRDWAKQLEVSI